MIISYKKSVTLEIMTLLEVMKREKIFFVDIEYPETETWPKDKDNAVQTKRQNSKLNFDVFFFACTVTDRVCSCRCHCLPNVSIIIC
jgi:hypothetical protein